MFIITFTAPACLTEDLVVSRVGSGDPKRETNRKPSSEKVHCEGSLESSSRRNLTSFPASLSLLKREWIASRYSVLKVILCRREERNRREAFLDVKEMEKRWKSRILCMRERSLSQYKSEVRTKRNRDPILLWWSGKLLRENSLSLLLSFYIILFQFGLAPCELTDNVSYFFWNWV